MLNLSIETYLYKASCLSLNIHLCVLEELVVRADQSDGDRVTLLAFLLYHAQRSFRDQDL